MPAPKGLSCTAPTKSEDGPHQDIDHAHDQQRAAARLRQRIEHLAGADLDAAGHESREQKHDLSEQRHEGVQAARALQREQTDTRDNAGWGSRYAGATGRLGSRKHRAAYAGPGATPEWRLPAVVCRAAARPSRGRQRPQCPSAIPAGAQHAVCSLQRVPHPRALPAGTPAMTDRRRRWVPGRQAHRPAFETIPEPAKPSWACGSRSCPMCRCRLRERTR